MAILEEAVREENEGLTEEEIEEEQEVKEAELQQSLMADAYGAGLDHQTVVRYDMMAHHISHAMASKNLFQAETLVKDQWDPLHAQYQYDFTALTALESIKGHVIAPALEKKTKEARERLEERATALVGSAVLSGGQSREEVQEQFCGDISNEVCGVSYHPVAVQVFEQLVSPMIKTPEPEPAVVEKQEEKAKEEEQEEEQQEMQ